MIRLNKTDLQLLIAVTTEEQRAIENNMKEYYNVPDEMMSRICSIGRLRVWACEQLEEMA